MRLSPHSSKMLLFFLQKFFVIFCSNEALVSLLVSYLVQLPRVGPALEAPVKEFLAKQKEKLHRRPEQHVPDVSCTELLYLLKFSDYLWSRKFVPNFS